MAKAYLHRSKESRVHSGHPWIFRSDIERVEGSYTPGDVVDVHAARGTFLGRAFYNPQSQISLRMLTRHDEPVDADFFYRRLQTAWAYRKRFADPMSCRLAFAESDLLPALIVDKFAEVLVLQTLCLGIDRWKGVLVEQLADIVHPRGIYERNDVPVRTLEGMQQQTGLLYGEAPERVDMVENGLHFRVDVQRGQKTGFFLDQKENRAALRPLCAGARVLDCFCHNGSFALHAARYGAADCLGVDISEDAVAVAQENAALNGLSVRFEAHNAFDYLREQYKAGEKYDVVILDPPAFTKTRAAVPGALRGYKEINLRAMKLLREGGYLVTCSCSQHVDRAAFMGVVQSAARDARKVVRQVEFRTQGKDHPILLASSETEYLKCAILQVFS